MSLAAQLPALQIAVPLLTAPLLVLLRGPGLAWAAACAASVMALVIAIGLSAAVLSGGAISYEMGGWPAPYGITLEIDAFSALVLLLVTGASAVALLAGRESLGRDIDPGRQHLFYAAWLVVLAGLSGIAITGDAFNVFVFMEISSLATYILVAAGPDRRALTRAFKYLVMGTIGATFYLIGVGLVYMMTGTLNFGDMEARIAEVSDQRPILVAAGFITVGLALKAAVFPLHVWLPGAYSYAPHIVTAFLAACSTKVAIYVLLRFEFFVFQGNLDQHALQFGAFLAPLALLGILVGSAVAMVEDNLKRLLPTPQWPRSATSCWAPVSAPSPASLPRSCTCSTTPWPRAPCSWRWRRWPCASMACGWRISPGSAGTCPGPPRRWYWPVPAWWEFLVPRVLYPSGCCCRPPSTRVCSASSPSW